MRAKILQNSLSDRQTAQSVDVEISLYVPVIRSIASPSHRCFFRCSFHLVSVAVIIPAKAFARDYGITGIGLSVSLSVCLFVTTITK